MRTEDYLKFRNAEGLPPSGKQEDLVNKPSHYNQDGIECIEAIRASMSRTEFKGYLKGNIEKYLWRYSYKNGVEDLKKAKWYLDKLIFSLTNE